MRALAGDFPVNESPSMSLNLLPVRATQSSPSILIQDLSNSFLEGNHVLSYAQVGLSFRNREVSIARYDSTLKCRS